jgi:hypothetical protein
MTHPNRLQLANRSMSSIPTGRASLERVIRVPNWTREPHGKRPCAWSLIPRVDGFRIGGAS